MNRKLFYNHVRVNLFNGTLTQSQVDGTEAILDYWDNCPLVSIPHFLLNWNVRCDEWLAYILATVYWETARTMQPIREYGSEDYFTRLYEHRRDLGNDQRGDGARFCGRGLVQITGRRNYTEFTRILRMVNPSFLSLVVNPDLACRIEYALPICFYGMVQGTFTAKALKHYLGDPSRGQKVDYVSARRIINGLDKASEVAQIAVKFRQAIA